MARRVSFYRNRPRAGENQSGTAWEDEPPRESEGIAAPQLPGLVGGVAIPGHSPDARPAEEPPPPRPTVEHVATYCEKGRDNDRVDVKCSCGWHSGRTWNERERDVAKSAFNRHKFEEEP